MQVATYFAESPLQSEEDWNYLLTCTQPSLQKVLCSPTCIGFVLRLCREEKRVAQAEVRDLKRKCFKQCSMILNSVPMGSLPERLLIKALKARTPGTRTALWQALQKHAADTLIIKFGNLEAIMSDIDSLDDVPMNHAVMTDLLGLPYDCMLTLLSDSRLQVVSENTVAAAVLCYCIAQDKTMNDVQVQSLLDQLRPQHMTTGYLNTLHHFLPELPSSAAKPLTRSLSRCLGHRAAADMPCAQAFYSTVNGELHKAPRAVASTQVLHVMGRKTCRNCMRRIYSLSPMHMCMTPSSSTACGGR